MMLAGRPAGRIGPVGLLLGTAVLAVVGLIPARSAAADTTPDSVILGAQAQADDLAPIQPPDTATVDPPSWAKPFTVLDQLPLWALTALVAGAIAGLSLVVPMVMRWLWNLGAGSLDAGGDSSHE